MDNHRSGGFHQKQGEGVKKVNHNALLEWRNRRLEMDNRERSWLESEYVLKRLRQQDQNLQYLSRINSTVDDQNYRHDDDDDDSDISSFDSKKSIRFRNITRIPRIPRGTTKMIYGGFDGGLRKLKGKVHNHLPNPQRIVRRAFYKKDGRKRLPRKLLPFSSSSSSSSSSSPSPSPPPPPPPSSSSSSSSTTIAATANINIEVNDGEKESVSSDLISLYQYHDYQHQFSRFFFDYFGEIKQLNTDQTDSLEKMKRCYEKEMCELTELQKLARNTENLFMQADDILETEKLKKASFESNQIQLYYSKVSDEIKSMYKVKLKALGEIVDQVERQLAPLCNIEKKNEKKSLSISTFKNTVVSYRVLLTNLFWTILLLTVIFFFKRKKTDTQ